MDLVIAHPFLHQMGGGEKVVLKLAEKFSPIIYSVVYEPKKTFPEFKEFDIRLLPKNINENLFFFLKNDARRHNAISAGFRYYSSKIKDEYDVINAHGSPSEWIANKNERVCWYVHSPNREAYDLYKWRSLQLKWPKRVLNKGLVEIFKSVESRIMPKIEKICTNSEVTNERIKKYLKRNDAEVIHPGVEPKEFHCEEYEKYFLYPSRFVPEKRFEIAIDAFKQFNKQKKGWKLVLAGFLHDSKREQEYLVKLKRLAYGLPIEFILNPSDKKLSALYSRCYATLFTAINEDWGLVPLESMASKKPCISMKEGGPCYSILNKKTGFLIEKENEMTKKMIYLADNPDKNEWLGKNGRERVLKNYTWKIFLKKMKKAFDETKNQQGK